MGVGPITPDSSGGELMGTQLAAHLADTSDAHDASAISFSATGNLSSTDVQAALVELDNEKLDAAAAAAAYVAIVESLMTPLLAGVGVKIDGATISADTRLARVTADIAALVNNSTALVDIPEMTLAVEANAVYELRGMLIYSVAQPSIGVKVGWTVPAGVTGQWAMLGAQLGATANTNASARWQTQNDYSETAAAGGAGTGITSVTTRMFALLNGLLITGGTAGDVTMRAAQNTANASNLSIGTGAYYVLDRKA